MKRENAIIAPVDDRSNALVVNVGPSKESHESGLTDAKTEALGNFNFDHISLLFRSDKIAAYESILSFRLLFRSYK